MTARLRLASMAVLWMQTAASAHSGPPYPIVTERPAGAYIVSIWTDPDATDDGSPGGQFWVVLHDGSGRPAPAQADVEVAVKPSDRDASWHRAVAAPVDGDVTRRFAALPMDHEGPYAVSVTVSGAGGRAAIDAAVEATYDSRPSPYLLGVYVLPFVLVGALWMKLILRRRGV